MQDFMRAVLVTWRDKETWKMVRLHDEQELKKMHVQVRVPLRDKDSSGIRKLFNRLKLDPEKDKNMIITVYAVHNLSRRRNITMYRYLTCVEESCWHCNFVSSKCDIGFHRHDCQNVPHNWMHTSPSHETMIKHAPRAFVQQFIPESGMMKLKMYAVLSTIMSVRELRVLFFDTYTNISRYWLTGKYSEDLLDLVSVDNFRH